MSEKAGNNFWDLYGGELVKFPTRRIDGFEMVFVAKLPKEYQDTGLKKPNMMAYRDDKTGKEYIMLVKSDALPIRFNIEKNRFEKMESTADDRWEWKKY